MVQENGGELTQRVRDEGASDGAGCEAARGAHHHLLLVALVLLCAAVTLGVMALGIASVLWRPAVSTAMSAGLVMAVPGRSSISAAAITAVATSLRVIDGPLPLRASGRRLGIVPATLAVVVQG